MTDKRAIDVLGEIQSVLKAPKGQYNSFGGYAYRSCEDILEAVKPLLKERGAVLTISDEIEHIGGRWYVRAVAKLHVNDEVIETAAFAREAESKKGMDESQITGAASSYARKYALNGMFCIDDTKDADATNDHGKGETAQEKKQTAQKPAEKKAPTLIERAEACKAYFAKAPDNSILSTTEANKKVLERTTAVLSELKEAGKNDAANELKALVNKKLKKD